MSGNYFQPIKREFLNLSGGTVTGNTIFTQNLSATTYYSGNTPLEEIIVDLASNYSGITGFYLPISGGTGGPYEFVGNTTADTIFVSSLIEPKVDNTTDVGTTFKRFRSLNTVNGIAINFTASTRVTTSEIKLVNTTVTEDNIILSGYTLDGGVW
ncbi:MAG: hypothetical protein KatS3mg035_1108 [Bacteroidia bacterium]|nr:MAG: hypothetical protein KatS3mg035_1108 [Bacteroidia bacterium]